MSQPRFDGKIVRETHRKAVHTAYRSQQHVSRPGDIAMHVWCDGSHSPGDDSGGIAVTYYPWLPSWDSEDEDLILAAWSLRPLWGSYFREVLSICEALYIIWQQLIRYGNSPEVLGESVKICIYNDKLWFLEWLDGVSRMDLGIYTLCKPLIDFIVQKSAEIRRFPGIQVRLSLHWIPGHYHNIIPHVAADRMARNITRMGRAIFWNQHHSFWTDEPQVITLLRGELEEAALAAASLWPELQSRLTGSIGQVRAMVERRISQRFNSFEYGLGTSNPPYQLSASQPSGGGFPPPPTLESIANAPPPPANPPLPPPLEDLPPPPPLEDSPPPPIHNPEPPLTLKHPLPPRPTFLSSKPNAILPPPAWKKGLPPQPALRHPLPPRPISPRRKAPTRANRWAPWPSQRRPIDTIQSLASRLEPPMAGRLRGIPNRRREREEAGTCVEKVKEVSTADQKRVVPDKIWLKEPTDRQDVVTEEALGAVRKGVADQKCPPLRAGEEAPDKGISDQMLSVGKDIGQAGEENPANTTSAADEFCAEACGVDYERRKSPRVEDEQKQGELNEGTVAGHRVVVAESWSWREADEEIQGQLEELYQRELELGFVLWTFVDIL
ncbi:hypothetical protein B0T19DRAFT_404735 [Cercophora scortea]|uniref:Uncharacterized protein n=1 Tax=Cercophora scortea TaxID=314031 RepID=A0AAE0M5J7_9PEZI|nr:hypothetical protein B0T19DRAFT_404735 [Cercophora scortea]